jgi:hypothetical protein
MPSERGRILGIGGIFFKSTNQEETREWYGKHLELADKGGGSRRSLRKRAKKRFMTRGIARPTP